MTRLLKKLLMITLLISTLGMAQAMVTIGDLKNVKPDNTLQIKLPTEAITEQALSEGKLTLHFVVENPQCGWTMFPNQAPGLALLDGEQKYPVLPRFRFDRRRRSESIVVSQSYRSAADVRQGCRRSCRWLDAER